MWQQNSIKKWVVLSGFIFFLTAEAHAQPGFGIPRKINENWSFSLTGDSLPPSSNSRWQLVQLPHDWSIRQPLDPHHASSMGYLPGGIGWYKKKLHISQTSDKVYLYFEGAYNRSEIFINGKSVGGRPNGYISFLVDITPYIQFNRYNELLVRIDHHRAADSRWYTGAGLYRNVWLVYANRIHIAQWGVYAHPQTNNMEGLLNVEVTVDNETPHSAALTVVTELLSPQGIAVASTRNLLSVAGNTSKKLSTQLKINHPELWSLEHPALYRLHTRILKNGKQTDSATITTGFRKFTFDPDKGFALNDQWMKIKGVCLHHDAGVLGAAMYKSVWRRRLRHLKDIGVNAIRTSHNPQATMFYELCDELGFLVMDEAFDEWEYPKRKWLEGWNLGKPGYDGTYDFFKEWGMRDLADMVKRDRNHPCIFAWSIGNEVDYPNDPYSHPVLNGSEANGFTQKIFGGYKPDAPDAMRLGEIAKKLVAVVKRFDQSRPVTAGLAGVAMSNETGYPEALDIAGYNYTENRYLTDHKKYPERVIFGSENRHDLSAWKSVTDNAHIFGQFLWTGIDYLGESGKWPSRGFYSGLLDFAGFIKPRGYFRKSLWSKTPMAYLGTYPLTGSGSDPSQEVLTENVQRVKSRPPSMDAWASWNYQAGQWIRVVCYTNAPRARLWLNNQQVGDPKNKDTATGIISWDLPFQPGTLKVEGVDEAGHLWAADTLQTTGKPYAIKLLNCTEVSDADVIQVALQLVDEKGFAVTNSDQAISCNIKGEASLLGMEAGNNRDMSDYTDSVQHTFKGRLIVYLIKRKPGNKISIRFTSGALKPVSISL